MLSKEKSSRHNRISLTGGDRVFVTINGILLALFFCITLYPMVYVLSASFSDPNAVASGEMVLFPVRPSMQCYQYLSGYKEIWIGYGNTFFYTIIGTLMNLAATLPCAYALSRRDIGGRGFVMTLFVITMYFGGGLIPSYLNIRALGLLNTRWVMLLNGLVSAYNLIVARTFFSNTIPWELHEAAFLDGCSDFRLFTKIILPLSAPIIVVMALYYGVGHWNAYFNAFIYLSDRTKFPLQVFLKEILMQSKFAENEMLQGGDFTPEQLLAMTRMTETANMLKYGIIVISTVPMLCIYPFLQRYFAKGVMIGSVKG